MSAKGGAGKVPRWPRNLLLAGMILFPVLATASTFENGDFTVGLLLMTTLSVLSNCLAGLRSPLERTLRVFTTLLGFAVLPMTLYMAYPTLLLPPEAYSEQDSHLVILMTYLVIASGFFAGTEYMGLRFPIGMPVVPGLSAFGLNASRNFSPELNHYFLAFAVFSVASVIHEMFLRHVERGSLPATPLASILRRQWWLVGSYAGIVGILSLMLRPMLALVTPQWSMMAMRTSGRDMTRRVTAPAYSTYISDLELAGGTYSLSTAKWMYVKTPLDSTKWRGRLFGEYTGQRWLPIEADEVRPAVREADDWWRVRNRQTSDRLIREEFRAALHMPPILYCSGDIVRAQYQQPVFTLEPFRLPRVRMMVEAGDSYTVESAVPDEAIEPLREANLPPPPSLDGKYLQLPPTSAPLARLARSVASGESTPYRKAEALSRFLTDRCLYSLTSPQIPSDEDAATYFVTTSRQGACDLFASALAVMSRSVGIPARMATGFLSSGETEDGWLVVRERDAHAWTEIYVEPFGWVSMDPTQDAIPDASTLQILARRLFSRNAWRPSRLLLGMPIIILIAVAAVMTLRMTVTFGRNRPGSSARIVIASYLSACKDLSRRGHRREPQDSPFEFLGALERGNEMPNVRGDFSELTSLCVQAGFSPDPISAIDATRARELARSVRRNARSRNGGDTPSGLRNKEVERQ